MSSYNKIMIMGNLTRDPEVKYTPRGAAVAELGLAINRSYKVGEETREEVTFVDVVLWSRLAELAGQYLTKGSPVFVEGRLQTESWTDKQSGQKRSKMRVVGESMQFLGSKSNGQEAPRKQQSQQPTQRSQQAYDDVPEQGLEDDDIPF